LSQKKENMYRPFVDQKTFINFLRITVKLQHGPCHQSVQETVYFWFMSVGGCLHEGKGNCASYFEFLARSPMIMENFNNVKQDNLKRYCKL